MSEMQTAIEETVFNIVPGEVQFKGRMRLEGQFLVGEVWVQYGGLPPRKVTARVDMAEILRMLQAPTAPTADAEISGLFDFVKKGVSSISNAAKSIGRQKLIKGLSRGVKSVIRSPVTGSIMKAAQTVFPPIGVPAAAAYQASNAALAALDKRGNVLDKLRAFAGRGAAGALDMASPYGASPQLQRAVQTFIQTGRLDPGLARVAESIVGPGASQALAAGQHAMRTIKDIGARARAGDPRAQMQAAVLRRVNVARQDIAQKNAQLMALRQTPIPRPPMASIQPVPRFPMATTQPVPPRFPMATTQPVPPRFPMATTQPVPPRLPVQPFRF